MLVPERISISERVRATLEQISGARLGMLLGLVVVISGCSSMTRVQTWEGQAVSEREIATLKAPSTITVSEVNGRSMDEFLLTDVAVDYQLLVGNNTVVFSHKTIWARPSGTGTGNARVAVIESEPQVVEFEARAGEVYRFEVPEVTDRREAEALAGAFRASIVDSAGNRVADAAPQGAVRASEPSGPSARQPAVPDAAAEERDDTLGALQNLWREASDEQRREFLRWALD
ncbi:DUF2057 family protein [uncultured Marinobacter sp.]|uniref:DUF2057 family protein n=1 Tax=uncultured Marinobacter sp. TaxID=187379 RepID=UPI0030D9EA08